MVFIKMISYAYCFMNIDYNKLRVFLNVVEYEGVTKAAKKLHRTQSAVSQAILGLEKQLGIKLITWEGKRLQLTRAGKRLYATTHSRIDAIDEELSAIATSQEQVSGCIEIGMLNDDSTRMHELIFAQIAKFRQSYPAVTFEVHFDTSRHLEESLISQDLDIGFFINFQALHRFSTYEITTERHLIVSSPAYLKKMAIRSVQDVVQADLIDIDPQFTCFTPWVSFHKPTLVAMLEKKRPAVSAANFRLIRQLILDNQGLAVLPSYLIEDDLQKGNIVQVLPELLALQVWVNGATLLGRDLRLCEELFLQRMIAS